MNEDDNVHLDTVTAHPGSGYRDAYFEDKKFMATSVPTATTLLLRWVVMPQERRAQ